MCLNLVKIAIHENYLLPGMKPKSKTSRIRRREKLKISNDHESSDSDFEGKLEISVLNWKNQLREKNMRLVLGERK